MTEIPSQASSQHSPLKKRLVAFAILIPLMASFVYAACWFAYMAQTYEHAGVWIQGPLFLLAAMMLLLPAYFAVTVLRRKWKTGKFLLTPDEVVAQRAAAQEKMGAGKPFWPQALSWSPVAFVLTVCLLAAFLCVVGTTKLSPGPSSHSVRILLFGVATGCLFVPVLMLIRAIRRQRKTGSFLPSQNEIQATREKCAAPKPLWQRILLPIVYWANAILFTESALTHHRYPMPAFERWGIAALWWFCAIQWTWQLFRPAKCAIPSQPRVTPP